MTLLITGAIPLFQLYVVQAGISSFSAIFDASYNSCLPNLVGKDNLNEANSTLQTSISLGRIAGPIIGGVAIAWFGATNAIYIDVFSYVISIVSVFYISQPFSANVKVNSKQTFIQDAFEGVATVWNITVIRYLMLFAMLINLVGPGMDVALLYRIEHELVLGSQWAGIIMTGLSVGMLFGSLLNKWLGKKINMGSWLTFSIFLQIFPPVVLSISQNPYIISFTQIFVGVLLVAWNIQSVTLRQTLIPDRLLGRCTSVFRLSAWVSIPLGDGLAGIVSQNFGTNTFFIFAACVLSLISITSISSKLSQKISLATTNTVLR